MRNDCINAKFDLPGKTYRIEILKIGKEYCRPDKKHESLVRSYYSIHFILDGCGTLCVGDKKYVLGRGTAFALYGGEQYDYYPDAYKPWSYVWINFASPQGNDDLDTLFDKCGFSKEKPYAIFNDSPQIANNFLELFNSYDGMYLQNLKCTGYCSLILSQLIEAKNKYSSVEVKGSISYKYFADIITYINSNYRLNLTIGQIASDMSVSEKQIYGMFKKFINMRPNDYINRYRISNACIFFKQRNISVEDVALMVGIDNPKYFTRLFNKWKGMSPREYKNNCDGDDPFLWLKEKNINY